MIEIEKKFLLTTAQQQNLLRDAKELSEKTFRDSYFDTDTYDLTANNLWLRKRDEAFELKAPLKSIDKTSSATNRFREITVAEEIREELQLSEAIDFETALSMASITCFMTCFTRRKSYEKQGFRIDVDTATYLNSSFTYALAEIELLLDDESEADEAERRIIKFANELKLETDKLILGKVAAYLKAGRPQHYNTLIQTGVLQ